MQTNITFRLDECTEEEYSSSDDDEHGEYLKRTENDPDYLPTEDSTEFPVGAIGQDVDARVPTRMPMGTPAPGCLHRDLEQHGIR